MLKYYKNANPSPRATHKASQDNGCTTVKIAQSRCTTRESWVPNLSLRDLASAKLVLAFGARDHLAGRYSELRTGSTIRR